MTRPFKQGLDYFPLDVNCDDRVKLIDARFGVAGFGILIKLWQIIYDNGYFIKWTEKEVLLYKNRINADINLINDVINECLKWGVLNTDTFANYEVLTSRAIQKRYLEASKRRTTLTIYLDYWEIDIPENTTKLSVNIVPKTVNASSNLINVDNNLIKTDISTQKKKKEIKIEKRKDKDSTNMSAYFDEFYEAYPKKAYKAEAMAVFNSFKVDEGLFADIMYGLDKWKTNYEWTKENGRYIPQAKRWLKNKEWENEPTQQAQPAVKINGAKRQLSVKEILEL